MSNLNSKIIEEYRLGKTYQQIGEENSITRERVRQIIMKGIYYEIEKSRVSENSETSIEELNLSQKTFSCLISSGIPSVEKLIKLAPEEILGLPSMGKSSLTDIEVKLRERNLSLGYKKDTTVVKRANGQFLKTIKYSPIEILGLSERALNSLIKNGVKSIEKLLTYTPNQIINFSSMGEKSLNGIIEKLAQKNLSLSSRSIKNILGANEVGGNAIEGMENLSVIPSPRISDEEYQTYFERLKREHSENYSEKLRRKHRKEWIENEKGNSSDLLEMACKYDSLRKFSKEVHIGATTLINHYPEVVAKISSNREKAQKKWSRYYENCVKCKTNTIPHRSDGMCGKCYFKSDKWKAIRKAPSKKHKRNKK
jgi:hypothetical protein